MNDKVIKILLIEDDEMDHHLVKTMLSKAASHTSYALDWSRNFDSGLKAILEKKHDLYLIDYKLDQKDGIDLARKASKSGQQGPFILLTGLDNHALYERSLETGVYDYILKNELSPSLLDRAITYALERKRVENALKEEKAFTSYIVSEIPYLIVSVNGKGLISSVNPAVRHVTGFEENELVGKHWKTLVMDEQHDETQASFEGRLIDKNEREKIIHWHILAKKPGGGDSAFVLSGKDMTDLIEMEAQERQRQKMEALGQLAGGVAHEINNLLLPISLAAEMIKDKTTQNDFIQGNADKILRNAEAAAVIVDDILAFTRKSGQNRELLPIGETLSEALAVVRDMLPTTITLDTKGIEQSVSYTSYLNKNDMMRVMANLLTNASHAMNKTGRIKISAEMTTRKKQTPHQPVAQDYLKIDVSDTGKGIPEEHMDNIFVPFFTTKDVGQGTGLGLPIVYNIIQGWQGTIEVKSKVGKGTTFSLLIPIHAKSFNQAVA